MEKPYFSILFIRHGFLGWLFVLSLCLCSFASYGQTPAPTGLSVASLTQTTAVVSWECEPSPDRGDGDFLRYDYVVSTNQLSTALANSAFAAMTEGSNGVLLVGRAVELEASQLLIDELSTGTMYYMLIRQNAEDIYGGTSSWVALSFNTLCEGTALPIALQTFGDASMPACWVGAGENIPVLQSAYRFGDSGNALKLESTSEYYSYLFTPVILGASNTSELVFKMFATGSAYQRFSVGVADANDIMNYVPVLQDSIAPGSWRDIAVVDVNAFFTNNYMWVIYAEAGVPAVFYVDNVEVREKPSCIRPQGLKVTNVTATSATFEWNSQGTETAWNLELTEEGTETPIVVSTTENPFTYEGLSEARVYSARIQADCGTDDGVSEWSTSITFATPQMPLELPFQCDFEGDVRWNLLNGDAGNAWFIGDATNNGGSNALYISNDGGVSNSYAFANAVSYVWATRLLDFPEDGTYSFSFDWRSNGETSYDYMMAVLIPADVEIEEGTSNGLESSIPNGWISLSGTTPFCGSSIWMRYSTELHIAPGQYNLAFFWKNDNSGGDNPPAAVDNISITRVLCPKPELPTLSGLNATDVTLVFADDNRYNVKVFETQVDNPETEGTAVFEQEGVTTQCRVTGLTPNTVYYAYVMAVCEDDNSVWVGPLQIKTLCSVLTESEVPYVNGFEDELANFPDCWYLIYSDYEGYPLIMPGTEYNPAFEGNKHLYSTYTIGSSYEDPESFNAMVALPGLSDDVNINDLSLAFYMKGIGAEIVVGVMNSPIDVETFTEVATLRGTNAYEEYWVDFSSYTETGRYIALKYDSVFASVFIDNVRILKTPTCFKPISYLVKDVMSTEAAIEVMDVDHANIVDVEYGLTGFEQGTGTMVQIPAGDSVIVLSGLIPQTGYDVYVRNRCDENDMSEWLPKQTFVTMCVPENVTSTSPFEEDFETYAEGEVGTTLGGCWQQHSSNNAWTISSGNEHVNPCFGTKGVTLKYSSDAWMYRAVHLVPGNYQFSCYAVLDVSGGCTLSLGFGESFDDIDEIHTQQIIDGDCQLVRSEFMVNEEGDYVIGIHGQLTSSPWYVMVDNIRLMMVNCLTPSTPAVSEITDASAKISWGNTNASSYNLKVFVDKPENVGSETPFYSKTSIVPVEGVLSESIVGLAEKTTYYASVQSVCDDGSVSEWSNLAEFTTECSAIILSEENPYVDGFEADSRFECWKLTIQEEGDAGTSTSIKHSETTSAYAYKTSAVSPKFAFEEGDNMANYQLSGFAYASVDTLGFTISVMKNSDREGIQTVREITLYKGGEWREFTITLDPLAVLPDVADYKYIEFNFTEEDRIYIDDLRFEVIPTCPKPTDISFSEIGETSVKMDWVSNGVETQWRVVLKEIGATDVLMNEVISQHPYEFTNLKSNTSYEVSLRAVCEVDVDESAEVKAVFKTSCGVVELPFSENFNSLTSGIPDCWDNSQGTTENSTYLWSYYSEGYEGSGLRFNSYSNPREKTNYLMTPAISLTENAELRFMCKKPNAAGQMSVYASVDGADFTNDTLVAELESSEWNEFVYDLSEYTGHEVVIVFEAISNYGSGDAYMYLDNVSVGPIPTCPRPQGVNVAASTTEVTLTVEDEDHTAWEYVYGTPGFDIEQATPVTMSSKTTTITNLNAGTVYNLYVRAVCTEEDKSAWYGPVFFSTTPLPVSLPYSCDFEGSESWIMLNGVSENAWTIGTAVNNGGSKALYISNDEGTSNEYTISNVSSTVWAIKEFEVVDEAYYSFGFDWKANGESSYDYLCAMIIPGNVELVDGSANGLDMGSNLSIPDGWISLSNMNRLNMSRTWQNCYSEHYLVPGLYQLAFFWKNDTGGGSNPPAAIDNVSIQKQMCPNPVGIAVNNVTETGAQLVFAVEGTYNVKVFDSLQEDPGTTSDVVYSQEIVGADCTISDLTPGTQYYAYVQAICAEGVSSRWVAVSPFYTSCVAVSLPYSENFDEWNEISPCWTNEHTEGMSTTVWSVSTTNAYSGKAAYLNYQASGNEVVLSTPALMVEAGKEYHVSFYLHHHTGSGYADEHLNVYKGTTPLPSRSSTILGTSYLYVGANDGLGSVAGEYKHEFRWFQTTTENIYINFEIVWGNGLSTAIDEVVVEEVPSCEAPVSVKVSDVTPTSVELAITDPYGSAWEVVAGPKGFNPNDETVEVTQLSSPVGIVPGAFEVDTEYKLYVRTDCGTEDGVSNWYGPVSFEYVDWTSVASDGLGLISSGDYPWEIIDDAGTQKAQSTNAGIANSTSDLVATFALEEGEKATLSFEYYASSEDGYISLSDYLVMFVDPDEQFANSDYDSSFGKKGGANGQSGTYSLEFDEPGLHTIMWRYYKDYGGDAGDDLAQIWDISLVKENFFVPEGLKISNVTENSAMLSWIPSVGATGHQVCLINVGVDTLYVDDITSAHASLTSLQPNTEYIVMVRSTRGVAATDTTAWSAPLNFRTPMLPVVSSDLPYNQDWEGVAENANWALLEASASVNKWIISDKDANAVKGNVGSALYISYDNSINQYSTTAATSVYAYRSFSLEAGAYSISFDWKANGEDTHDYLRAFLVSCDVMLKAGTHAESLASLPEGWIALTGELSGATEWNYAEDTIILAQGGYYNLVFLWINDGSEGTQSPAAVDNVVLDLVDCAPVCNLMLADRGADYIEVVWEAPLTDTFEAVCVPSGTDISTISEDELFVLMDTIARFEGLTRDALYDVYVRSRCSDDTYSVWSRIVNVKVYPEYAMLPYYCDFETDEVTSWKFVNTAQTNQWHVGSAVNNGGENSLYISNDGGLNYAYQVTEAVSYVYAARKFRIAESDLYTISFDWLCKGETGNDYLQAYLVPGDVELTAGVSPTTTGWISLGASLVDKDTWQSFVVDKEINAGDYQLVFYWKNNGSLGSNPPAAIDNVSIKRLSCMYPTSLGVDGITDNSARLFWFGDANIGYEVRLDESEKVVNISEPFFSSILTSTTQYVDNLLPNTEYYVAVRSICAEGDTSRWVTYSFTTLCAPIELPYYERFDNNPIEDCWNMYSGTFTESVALSDLSSSTNWSYSSASYGNMDEHMCLNIFGSSRKDWLVTPSIVIEEVEGATLRFDLSLNPYSSSGVYEPGQQTDDKFIVAISTDNGRTWSHSNGRVWDNSGSEFVYDNISSEGENVVMSLSNYVEDGDTIRIAFYGESTVTGGDNNLRIDNIGVSMVETVNLFDSICVGSYYSDHGFNVSPDELTPNMHHQFSRFEMAVAEGVSDKKYVLDLYVYPDGNVVVYDTVCAGTPYTEYGFNIDNPVTRTYYSPSGLFTEYGCDSTVTLHLFVPETQFQESVAICEDESYEFGGQTLTESGTYTHTFAGMYCDSVVTLDLVVLPSETEESLTICYGDSVLFDNVWRKTSGDYTAVFANSLGCDSTVTLHLTVRDEIRYDYSGVLCVGGVYSDENFANLTEAGDHVVTLTSVTGCDSIVTLHLTEKTIVPTYQDEKICDGESYTFGDASYNTTGEYPYTFTSVDGCDSLVTLRLTVLPVSESDMTLELTTSELPYELKHNGETIYVVEEGTEPGTYWPEITIENGAANGCDSIINLTLTVKLGDALHLTDYEELEFWPNPIERGGKVVISADFSPTERANLKIEVYNSIGQCVATHRPTGESLYVEDFHVSGMYLVKVTTGTGRLYVGHVIVK